MFIHTIKEVRNILKEQKRSEKSIGFVPTMGFLHEGHLSLIKKAKEENDYVVVSVFVNPAQFGPNEDFKDYPRDYERDYNLSIGAGADLIFNPSIEEMYPVDNKCEVKVKDLSSGLCGASRPLFFGGIALVVTKLFNIINPTKAYFGQKDAQQLAIIKKLVKDLNFDLEIVACPLIREADGLAMSSRNIYLSKDERKSALRLSQSLFKAQEMIKNGERNPDKIKEFIKQYITEDENCNLDYIEIVDSGNIIGVEEIKDSTLIAVAANVGKTRLIDNILVEV
ncbi:pantothenate synthetase [Desulfonispora thiosulfatigenes DSM 11270]|uniref:Pantothenate synthetase n=1 Tax=Desulfonispora thiosulfatigenes DSM 11270 TaxID=656914 RepID=A0A1W1VH12_DESTI|nr:pantoate--beta-alanine ligase [Desulfonispora thiosulfatigenes]SMB92341.1 pantothenate synthetase [Desulfonispora thiosulfatigenes DSM 11270]